MITGQAKAFERERLLVFRLQDGSRAGVVHLGRRGAFAERKTMLPDASLLKALEGQPFRNPGDTRPARDLGSGAPWGLWAWTGTLIMGTLGGFELRGEGAPCEHDEVLAFLTHGIL